MTVEHIKDVALVHRQASPESAWTKMGQRVVEEFYLSHLLRPHPVVNAVTAFLDGKCAGFCISGVFKFRASGFLAENKNLLALSIAARPWLLFNPMFREKLKTGVRVLKRFDAKKQSLLTAPAGQSPRIDSFGVLVIAVSPRYQGLGIGKLLMENAEGKAAELGYKKMDLTVNTDNHNGIKFYESLNWRKHFTNHNWAGVMTKKL